MRQESGGYYVEPTLFSDVYNEMSIAREEIFGSVRSVLRFCDIQEAIAQANATPYGLNAVVWTADFKCAHRTARALRAGTVHINSCSADDITMPFVGFKQSGNGRDKSIHALDKYTEMKITWIHLEECR